jgi:hypothetical protein
MRALWNAIFIVQKGCIELYSLGILMATSLSVLMFYRQVVIVGVNTLLATTDVSPICDVAL